MHRLLNGTIASNFLFIPLGYIIAEYANLWGGIFVMGMPSLFLLGLIIIFGGQEAEE